MVNYEDFIKSAQKLLTIDPAEEINYRNAISRAYYAFYHRCLPLYTESNDKILADSHKTVVSTLDEKYQQTSEKKYHTASNRLDKLRKIRVKADYRLSQNISLYDAKRAVQSAQKAIDELEK